MKTYIVGNWKMNFTVGESSVYLHKLLELVPAYRDLEVIVAPSTVALQPLSLQTDRRKIRLAAQIADSHEFGAYTGATSCAQLRGIVDYCLIGHAERRHLYHESDKDIRRTVASALRNHITPILILGDTETERTFGESRDILRDQLLGGLADVSTEDLSKVVIAYDPIWAISSVANCRLASPEEVRSTVDFLRQILADYYGAKIAEEIPILFGGSITPHNAAAYLTIPGVNGLMMGKASLVADHFTEIINTAKRIKS